MLSHKAFSSVPLVIRAAGSRHVPASSVALSRFVGISSAHRGKGQAYSRLLSAGFRRDIQYSGSQPPTVVTCHYQQVDRRYLSSHPICEQIDCSISKDLSQVEYNNAYKFVYHQHTNPHGPWVKTLVHAQKLLQGISCPRVLVIGSGPGEPATMLASNFAGADIISAHSTTKCVDWASERFHKHGLSNVSARLVPSLEDLNVFTERSFDLVVSCYGLANAENPQAALNEIHRVLKPGGSLCVSVWENAGADPAADIILRHSCVGPKPWHKDENNRDVVGNFACPIRSKNPMSLSKPHLLEHMLEEAKLPVIEVARDQYPLKLGKEKGFAFKALTLPIQSELQELEKSNHYHYEDAAEAFEDVIKEGYMVKQHADGEMESPYNAYKFIVSRREYEDGDKAKDSRNSGRNIIKVSDIPKS